MKKKILIAICTLFAVCTMFIGMNKVSATIPAQAPQDVPQENSTKFYAILDEAFQYGNYINFDGTMANKDMRKIILTADSTIDPTKLTDDTNKGKWFSVYCLDGSLKFPSFSFTNAANLSEDAVGVQYLIMMALFNDEKLLDKDSGLYSLYEKANGYIYGPKIEYTLPENETEATFVQKVKAGTKMTINVKSLTYSKTMDETEKVVITAAELSKTPDATEYAVEIDKNNLMFDKYTSTVMSGDNYAHALWILEHSYPTFGLKESLEMAGVNYNQTIAELLDVVNNTTVANETKNELDNLTACTAKQELATKYGVTEAEVTTAFCENKIKEFETNSKIEDFVYSTVQYAIWKVNGGTASGGDLIGNVLKTHKLDGEGKVDASTVKDMNTLNALYQYLIKVRPEHQGYLNFQFDTTLKLNKPAANKEMFKETDTHYIYGPYTVDYNMISIKDVTVAFEGAHDGAELVDEAGNAISNVQPNQKFFIKAQKDKKVTTLKIKLLTKNAITFEQSADRGRIYYSYYPLSQNVVSGGKYISKDVEKTIDIVFNPKTGDSNIALLFVITLIGFSIGYVALIMKNNQFELN